MCLLRGTAVTGGIMRVIFAPLALVLMLCFPLFGDTYRIDGTSPNRWAAVISFPAPCGVQVTGTNDPSTWYPPLQIDSVAANNPSALCASEMRTLTDPDSVSVTSIGAVNPSYTRLPD